MKISKTAKILFSTFPHILILAITSPTFYFGVTRSWKFLILGLFLLYIQEVAYHWIKYIWDNGGL